MDCGHHLGIVLGTNGALDRGCQDENWEGGDAEVEDEGCSGRVQTCDWRSFREKPWQTPGRDVQACWHLEQGHI